MLGCSGPPADGFVEPIVNNCDDLEAITVAFPLSVPDTAGENFKARMQLVPGAIAVVVLHL
jgi:hypothetical protein